MQFWIGYYFALGELGSKLAAVSAFSRWEDETYEERLPFFLLRCALKFSQNLVGLVMKKIWSAPQIYLVGGKKK